ncbi:MAG: hypothetical protein ACKODZ_01005, partial [Verrucomicrobiota bacterium]
MSPFTTSLPCETSVAPVKVLLVPAMTVVRCLWPVALAGTAAACAAPRPSGLPRDDDWLVVVKSARLPAWWPWYVRFADHTWLDVKRGG